MCLGRKIDKSSCHHVELPVHFFNPGLKGLHICSSVDAMGKSEMLNSSGKGDSCLAECWGPASALALGNDSSVGGVIAIRQRCTLDMKLLSQLLSCVDSYLAVMQSALLDGTPFS